MIPSLLSLPLLAPPLLAPPPPSPPAPNWDARELGTDLKRRQAWEQGDIDYMGQDSFKNILAKISETTKEDEKEIQNTLQAIKFPSSPLPTLPPPPSPPARYASPGSLRIVSYNVCSIRARVKKGEWQKATDLAAADIWCLQETRCAKGKFPIPTETQQTSPLQYIYCSPGDNTLYSGVALLSRIKPIKVIFGFPNGEHQDRILTAHFDDFIIVNIYSPFIGEFPHKNLEKRNAWERQLWKLVATLPRDYLHILCGDFNTCPEDQDCHPAIFSPQLASCTSQERESFRKLLSLGLVDIYRYCHPTKTQYSFWSFAKNCRQKDVGMRLDHFLVSRFTLPLVQNCGMFPNITGSDHCPIYLELDPRLISPSPDPRESEMVAALTRAQAKLQAEIDKATKTTSTKPQPKGQETQEPEIKHNSPLTEQKKWKLRTEQDKDPIIAKIKEKLLSQPEKIPNFSLRENIVVRKQGNGPELLYVPSTLRTKVLKTCHDSVFGGHYGLEKTYDLIRSTYWWPNLKTMTADYIISCEKCQRFKPKLTKSGLLQPIKSNHPFQKMGIDFLELSRSKQGNCYCLVLVDLFSGFVYAVPTRRNRTMDAITALESLLPVIGIPEVLISDEGPHFKSAAFKEFVDKIGILRLSIIPPDAHHSNGAAEAAIKKVVNLIKFYLHDNCEDWDEILPYAINTINKSKQYHGRSALELLYGVKTSALGRLFESAETEEQRDEKTEVSPAAQMPLGGAEIGDFERYRQQVRQESREKRQHCQELQRKQYDRNREEKDYEIGDKVLVYFEPRAKFNFPAKLQPKFRIGTVISKDSPVTYTVEMADPTTSRNLRRVHVEFMKPLIKRQ